MVRNPSANREQFRPHDHPNDAFLLTTVVGSYPKPKWLNRADELVDDPDSKFDESDLEEAHDDACRLITHEHERAGLDTVVDGEMRRNEMVEFFADRIDGYEFNGPVKVWGHNYFDKPSVVEEVAYDEPWLVDEFEFTSNVAERPVKVPITGPYTLGFWAFNEAYPSTEELVYDLADLVNEEVEKLVEAGARYIQIDEPALATTPDDHAIVGGCLERIVDGVPEEFLDVAKSLGVDTDLGLIRKVVLPAALPELITGIRTGIGRCWMLIIAAELMGVPGVGRELYTASQNLSVDAVLAYILLMSLVYLVLDTGVGAVQNRVLAWQ